MPSVRPFALALALALAPLAGCDGGEPEATGSPAAAPTATAAAAPAEAAEPQFVVRTKAGKPGIWAKKTGASHFIGADADEFIARYGAPDRTEGGEVRVFNYYEDGLAVVARNGGEIQRMFLYTRPFSYTGGEERYASAEVAVEQDGARFAPGEVRLWVHPEVTQLYGEPIGVEEGFDLAAEPGAETSYRYDVGGGSIEYHYVDGKLTTISLDVLKQPVD